MAQKALVFGHADGDGHLATVQSAENLSDDGYEVVKLIADPTITGNWRFWERGFQNNSFEDAGLIVVTDIMMHPNDPARSLNAILNRVKREPERRFLIIDHHPIPIPEHLDLSNIEIRLVDTVYECCYGPPSELMLIASVCDRDETPVAPHITHRHRQLAKGINRAVTDRTGLAGWPTLNLIRRRWWAVFEALADEPHNMHRTMYGNRLQREPLSPLLQVAGAMRSDS